MAYVELHARSAFSFLRGASSPEQLARQCAEAGLSAMALCDRDGVYGAPRFFAAAREHGIRPIVGAELTMEDDTVLPVLVETRAGYQNLCRLITRTRLRGTKTEHAVRWDELAEFAEGLVCLTGDEEGPLFRALLFDDLDGGREVLRRLRGIFGDRHLFIEVQRHLWRIEDRILSASATLAREFGLPLLATNGVLYAEPEGQQVLDVMTCARFHTNLDVAGQLLSLNGARCLKSARPDAAAVRGDARSGREHGAFGRAAGVLAGKPRLRIPALPHARRAKAWKPACAASPWPERGTATANSRSKSSGNSSANSISSTSSASPVTF